MSHRLVTHEELFALGLQDALAQLALRAAQAHAPGWLHDLDDARDELFAPAQGGFLLALLDASERPLGWIGAAPAWGRVWEIQPLFVDVEQQRRGYGRELVLAAEARIAAISDALTLVVGTSDTTHATSLSDVDLYDDPLGRLQSATTRSSHSLEFWQRLGYRIVGIVPDAEGPGMPSITLAKRLPTR